MDNGLGKLTAHDLAALRRITLDVLDCRPWRFCDVTESEANANRLDFCDELQRRIVAEAAPAAIDPAKGQGFETCLKCGVFHHVTSACPPYGRKVAPEAVSRPSVNSEYDGGEVDD